MVQGGFPGEDVGRLGCVFSFLFPPSYTPLSSDCFERSPLCELSLTASFSFAGGKEILADDIAAFIATLKKVRLSPFRSSALSHRLRR